MQIRSTIAIALTCLSQAAGISVTLADDKDTKVTPEAPVGFVLVEEDQWHVMADEPDRHISRAREAFLMADAKTAAGELRKVAVHLRIASAHASERVKRGLVHSEHELTTLARHIESGTVKSVEDVDAATARALHALADYQYFRAADAWRKKRGSRLRAIPASSSRQHGTSLCQSRRTSASRHRRNRKELARAFIQTHRRDRVCHR